MCFDSFSSLTIYDPASGNFYNQTATGNVPNGRIEFCATGANSTNQTYEIFIYAGWGSNLGAPAIPFDEIYILTLPAFVWIKANYPPANPRHGHTCHTIGNRQMLVIGGVDTTASTTSQQAPTLDKATFATADQNTQGLAIFDMVNLTWSSSYDAGADMYVQSQSVADYYGQHGRDPATWGSSDLQTLFQTTHFTNATLSSSNSTSNTTATPSSSSSSPSNTGAIAGSVVGGVVGLALIAGLAWFLYRRSQKKKLASSQVPPGPATPGQEHAGGYSDHGGNYMNASGGGMGGRGCGGPGAPGYSPGTGVGGVPVQDYKYQPAPMSEVQGDSMPHQLATPQDHGHGTIGSLGSLATELDSRQHYELA